MLEKLVGFVQDGDEEQALVCAREAIREGVPADAMIEALTAGMREIGDWFAHMEIFLSEMMMAAHAMQAVMKELEPALAESSKSSIEKKGIVVIGTVEGDMHAIGKDIVITFLRAQGFKVHDLGINVKALEFVHKAEEVGADIIGASALMSTTMPGQKEIIRFLKDKHIREKYHVILGGAPVTQKWVEECGADSWGENAGVAAEILGRVMIERRARNVTL